MPMTAPVETPPEERHEKSSPIPAVVGAILNAVRKAIGRTEDESEVSGEPEAREHIARWNLRVHIEPDELDGGYVAECIDLPGCMAQGETEEEAVENLIDAFNGIVAVRMQAHLREIDFEMEPTRGGRELVISVP